MELTIEQALQQGVAAHKEGKVQEAERLYRAILQSQPLHPDANHNLGVIAVSVNKTEAALPLFKTALEANPKIEQFWLSYIDALLKEKQFDNAKQVLEQAKQQGLAGEKFDALRAQLSPIPQTENANSASPSQQQLRSLSEHYQDELSPAIELRETGRYTKAQEWLGRFIESDSNHPEALSLLSQVLLLDKKDAESEKVLSVAASINPELPSVYRNQARFLLKQSKPVEALEKAQSGCKILPEDPENLLVLAACLGANQRASEALPLIEKILEAKPNYAEAFANRALIRFRAKDIHGAITDAEMTVSLKPHLTQVWVLLSSLHYQDSNLSDAIEALRSAHKNEPKNTAFMIQLGEFLRQDNKASEAINILEQATELAPKDAKAWTNLGVAFQQEKRIADAKIAYEKALALNPKSAAIASNLGAIAKDAKEWKSALEYFGKALEIEPEFAEAHYNFSITLQELGRLDEAEASYTKVIALKPEYADAHSNLGSVLKELGRLDEAEASYTQAIVLKPDHAEAHSNLGVTLQELGRLDEAEASYAQAIALKPDYTEAHYNYGITLQELGRLDEAEASYTQAIALKPDYAEAITNKWLLLFDKKEFEAALSHSDAHMLKRSRAHDLITLYALGRIDEIYKRIEIQSKIDGENIYIAAFAAFISEAEKKSTAYKFCPEPINFVHFSNLASHMEDSNEYITGLIKELDTVKTAWEPAGKSTIGGFQSLLGKNLFESPSKTITQLKTVIINEIKAYCLKYHSESCSYIQKLPSGNNLFGWHVILKHQGHQTAHIHASGWLSGVIYLKVVPSLGKDEGAIEFSLNGAHYSNINSSNLTHHPEVGDIVFFPSSLHHKTISFTTDADRIIVSFDLIPEAAKH